MLNLTFKMNTTHGARHVRYPHCLNPGLVASQREVRTTRQRHAPATSGYSTLDL